MRKPELPILFNQYQSSLNKFTKGFYQNLLDPLYRTHRYFLGWIDEKGKESDSTGKAFRPSIMMLINEALGGNEQNILPLAMSIELFHNFSLIHDDIEDRDEIRRNRKTVWKIWGEQIGIISGSSMHALASKALEEINSEDKTKLIELRKIINETCIAVIEGQYLDIDFETRETIDVDDYLQMIEKKTGALIKTSVTLGSILEAKDKQTTEIFADIGKTFGHMFQIKDDVLGIWGNSEFGKPIGSDILKKKKSFPILKLIQSSDSDDKKIVYNIFNNEIDEEKKETILKLMDKYDVESYCESILNDKYKHTISLIKKLEISDKYKNMLLDTNFFLMHRKR